MDFFLFVSELIVYMTTGVEYKINTSVLALNMATYPRNFQALPFNYFLTFFFFFWSLSCYGESKKLQSSYTMA